MKSCREVYFSALWSNYLKCFPPHPSLCVKPRADFPRVHFTFTPLSSIQVTPHSLCRFLVLASSVSVHFSLFATAMMSALRISQRLLTGVPGVEWSVNHQNDFSHFKVKYLHNVALNEDRSPGWGGDQCPSLQCPYVQAEVSSMFWGIRAW